MPFPTHDPQWNDVRSFLEHTAQPLDAILAPNDFLEFFPGTYPYTISQTLSPDRLRFAVFHKGMVSEVHLPLALAVIQQFHPVFANSVFVVYAQSPITGISPPPSEDTQVLVVAFNSVTSAAPSPSCAAVITTYNNSQTLERSLPKVVALGVPVVLVDDGSEARHAQANQTLADRYQVPLLRLPTHLQRSSAINAGISYWLADPEIEWISCFRDDVDVKPDLLKVLQQVQVIERCPLLSGYDAPEHPALKTETIAGHNIGFKQANGGIHFHAHRNYWSAILPIPTPLRAVNSSEFSTDDDWWITAWSPQSIVKQGGHLVCIPNLVTLLPSRSPVLPVASPRTTQTSLAIDELNLEGAKVLVDGYNLQLKKGTGIKTYGLSLIEALKEMGATVDVLLSRGGYRSNQVLDEVIFFDNQASRQNALTLLKGVTKSLAGPLYPAKRRKSFTGYVVKRGQFSDDFLQYATSFNYPQCYDLANGLYNKLKFTMDLSTSEKIDIWHATYPLPIRIRGAKKITTVHDMIPLRLPYATLDDKENFYFKVRDALKDSAVTITVSENSKQDLLTYYDVDPNKIVVTYQPIALKPLNVSDEEITFFLQRYRLKPQNYLLFVGAIEPKKNVGRLIDAYASLDTNMPLVIVGKKGWLWEEELSKIDYLLEDETEQKRVKLLEYVSIDALRYLYKGAYALVFPSLYEGFGLPPVEAMNFGCPVITSNLSCLPEICGEAALYVDPYDVRSIKQGIEKLLSDPAQRTQLIQAGAQRVHTFSRDNYLKRLYKAYRQALDS